MDKLQLKYGLEDKPPLPSLILFGLQWLAIAIPMIIIVGKVVATLHYTDPAAQIIYIQKVFFLIGLSILVQVLWGHKLPVIIGPAAILLVGISASQGEGSISNVYTSILIGGLLLTILSVTGLFERFKMIFTPRVVVTILMLISFTLTPMLLDLIIPEPAQGDPLSHLLFALALITAMFMGNRFFTGIWKSTLIIWTMIAGSVLYFLLFPHRTHAAYTDIAFLSSFFTNFNTSFSIDIGVLISFLVCFLALAINDLGSIQSISEMLNPGHVSRRIHRGITLTGILNVLAGFFGVIGPVNYSLSPGVIASTGVASRLALIPTAIFLMAIAFIPPAITIIGDIPTVVIGSTFIYVLCSQLAAGLLMAFNSKEPFKLEHGFILGLPLILSVIISFLPDAILASFPLWLRPILGNGFVIGVIAVLIMEHIIYRNKQNAE